MSWNEITVLVERAKTGDREAYGELVVRRSPTLLECDGLAFLVSQLAQAVAQSLELGC